MNHDREISSSQPVGQDPLGGSNNPSTGVAYQIFTLRFIKVAKLQL